MSSLQRAARNAAVALLFLAGAAQAQTTETGVLRGRVLDASGQPIPNTDITVEQLDGSYRRRARSDSSGAYYTALLPPGTYRMEARRLGFLATRRGNIRIDAGGTRTLDIVLTAGAVELTPVEIRADDAPTIKRNETESKTTVTARELEQLPISQDLDRAIGLTPGSRPGQLWGGASQQANSYQLDGHVVNNPGVGGLLLSPNLSWFEQVEVRGLGAGAEFGSFQGGLVNLVTKSGTNTREQRLRVSVEQPTASELRGAQLVPEIADRRMIEEEARGPIVRDRAYYFVSGQLAQTNRRALNHLDSISNRDLLPYEQEEREVRLLGKLTFTPSSGDLVNALATYTHLGVERFGLTGREHESATTTRTAPATSFSAGWQRMLGDDSYFDVRLLHHRAEDRLTPSAGPRVPAVQTYQLVNYRQSENSTFSDYSAPRVTSAALSWSRVVERGRARDRWKAGVDGSWGSFRQSHIRNGGMTWRPRPNPSFAFNDPRTWMTSIPSSWGGETRLATRTTNAALWAEQELLIGRFAFVRGLRFSRFDGSIGKAGGAPTIPAWRTNGWDPRLGLVVDLSRHHSPDSAPSTTLKLHWGRYHQHVFGQLFDRVEGADAYTDQELWEYRGPSFVNSSRTFSVAERDSLAGLSLFRRMERAQLSQSGLVNDVRQPFVQQATASIERSIGRSWKVEALYVHRDHRNSVALVDRNQSRNYTAFDSLWVRDFLTQKLLDANGNPLVLPRVYVRNDAIIRVLKMWTPDGYMQVPGFTTADTATIFYDPQYEIANVDSLRRAFRQAQINLSGGGRSWSAHLSAVWTELRGNQASVTGYDALAVYGRDDVAGRGPGAFVRLNERGNSSGRLEDYTPLEFRVRGTRELRGFSLGAFLQHRLGDRITPTFTLSPSFKYYRTPVVSAQFQPLVFAELAGERMYLEPRGSRHYGHNTTLDLRVAREVPLGRSRMSLAVEAINALGDNAETLVNTALESLGDPNANSRFGDVLGRVPGRRIRVSADLAF